MSECYCSAVFTDVNDESALCGACALWACKQLMEVTRERDEARAALVEAERVAEGVVQPARDIARMRRERDEARAERDKLTAESARMREMLADAYLVARGKTSDALTDDIAMRIGEWLEGLEP